VRWYFALDEPGANGQTGEDAKTAVRSALAVGGLEPCLLYHGKPHALCTWMQRQGVRVIDAAPSFLDTIRHAQAAGAYRPHSIGHWLRVMIQQIEQARDYVLYTDCDIIFLKRFDWSQIRPRFFAAAPAFRPDNWNYFNAGVMVLNVPAMRSTYPALETHIRARILSGGHPSYDDETALNEAYRGHWDRLPPALNWKPYWVYSSAAIVLHFHGPKLNALKSMAAGDWSADNPTADTYQRLLTGHRSAYQSWLTALGDRMQLTDPALAIRFANAAAALSRLRPAAPDLSFLDFKMFPE